MRLTIHSSTVKGGRDEDGMIEEGEVVFCLSNRLLKPFNLSGRLVSVAVVFLGDGL